MTSIGDVQYYEEVSTKVIVHDKASKEDPKSDTPTFHDHKYNMRRDGSFRAQVNVIGEVSIAHKTDNEGNGHRTLGWELRTFGKKVAHAIFLSGIRLMRLFMEKSWKILEESTVDAKNLEENVERLKEVTITLPNMTKEHRKLLKEKSSSASKDFVTDGPIFWL